MNKALPLIACASYGFAAGNCEPDAPVICYTQDTCKTCVCLGPAEIIANAPVRPLTCDGDISITVSGLYWKAHQDGLEYAIDDSVFFDPQSTTRATPEANNLVDAHYLIPHFKWEFGFKAGIGYNTSCDGWDLSLVWTHFDGKAGSHDEAEAEDNHVLIAIWSGILVQTFNSGVTSPQVRDIRTSWNLNLNLADLTLGREYWVSHYISLRPFVGLRFASLRQNFDLELNGGGFTLDLLTDSTHLENNFGGTGILTGLDTNWNFGCGWSLYGNLASSIIYGHFDIKHNEKTRRVTEPFNKTPILETEGRLRASRATLDIGLGLEYSALVCDCKYGLTAQLGWEQHLFFHQNQMWRVDRTNGLIDPLAPPPPIPLDENVFSQRRGNLDTQGLTLSLRLDF